MNKKIWFISDTHLCHNKDFLYAPRGFKTIEEHDKTIIKNWNSTINIEDEVYHLGDVILNDIDKGIEYLKSLNGHIHIIIGNHDTDNKIKLYKECPNVISILYADRIKYGKYIFYLSHYPTLIHNYNDNKKIWNLHGHTHDKEKFCQFYHCYNVALDAHNNYPIEINDIIKNIKED